MKKFVTTANHHAKLQWLVIGLFCIGNLGLFKLSFADNDRPFGERSIHSESRVAERISPVGKVCVEGDETCAASSSTASATAGTGTEVARTPEGIYNSKCQACHASGVMGAPKPGDPIWQTKIEAQGLDAIVLSAINGINGMPARGLCMDCSDDDIKATVEYMIEYGK